MNRELNELQITGCFLCTKLSSKLRSKPDHWRLLTQILENIQLGNEESNFFCRACDELLDEFEECLRKLENLKQRIISDYSKSHQADELPVQDDSSKPKNFESKEIIFEKSKREFARSNVCEFCCKIVPHKELQTHKLSHSRDQNSYTCPSCGDQFKTFVSRNSHYLLSHTLAWPYKCDVCDKKFKLSKQLQSHGKSCFGSNKSSQIKCDICGKTFSQARNLRDHFNTTHADDKEEKNDYVCRKLQCPDCPKRFYKSDNLKSHILTHSSEKRFQCEFKDCRVLFKRAKSLKAHLKVKHGGGNLNQLCTFCGKSFKSYTGLKLHLAKHTGEQYGKRNFQCEVCEKTFRSPFDLKVHLVVHTKDKAFKCSFCGNSFTQKAILNDHLQIHLKTFQCHSCGKCFARKRYLENHSKACNNRNVDDSLDDQIEEALDGQEQDNLDPSPHKSEAVIVKGQHFLTQKTSVPTLSGIPANSNDQSVNELSAAEVLAQLTSQSNLGVLQYPGSDFEDNR